MVHKHSSLHIVYDRSTTLPTRVSFRAYCPCDLAPLISVAPKVHSLASFPSAHRLVYYQPSQTTLFESKCLLVSRKPSHSLHSLYSTSLKLCQVKIIAGIASILGIGSSHTEISEDEAFEFDSESEVAPEPESVKVKQEKKGKTKTKIEEPEQEESLMVESENNMEEEDEELGDEEYVPVNGGRIWINKYALDMW
jgi:hypothetical protein